MGVTKALAQFAEEGATASGQVLVDSGRLGPGEMLSVDLDSGKSKRNRNRAA